MIDHFNDYSSRVTSKPVLAVPTNPKLLLVKNLTKPNQIPLSSPTKKQNQKTLPKSDPKTS